MFSSLVFLTDNDSAEVWKGLEDLAVDICGHIEEGIRLGVLIPSQCESLINFWICWCIVYA